jgi:hypothetical protein
MWGTKTLARARRRLGLRADRPPDPPTPSPTPPRGDDAGAPDGAIAVVLTRPEKDALAATLEGRLGGATPRLDSPARVEAALAEAIQRAGGHGRPLVVRSPAGLYSPEYWHVRIDDADSITRAELGQLVGGRRID